MKKLLLFLAILVASQISYGQATVVVGTLVPYANGTMVEMQNGLPVANAAINGQGFMSIQVQNVPSHTFRLTAPSGSLFTPFSVTVTVGINQTTNISATLLANMPIPNPFVVPALAVTSDSVMIDNVQYFFPAAQVAGVLSNDGSGNLSWVPGGGGTTPPGGTTGAMQYNAAGGFGGLNGTGLAKLNGASAPTIAAAGTDYVAPNGSAAALSVASASAFGVAKCDNSTITCPGGVFTSIGGGSGIPYPSGSGIPIVVSGTSWGTTVAAPTGTIVGISDTQTLTNKSIAGSEVNSGTLPHAQLPTLLSADIPNNAASTSGNAATATTATTATSATTAGNLSGTPALPNGTTATTQTVGDNTTKIATDAFVLANAASGTGTVTHTAGPLTAQACMIGNGAADSKVDPNCTLDGSGNLAVNSVSTGGTTNGQDMFTYIGTPAASPTTHQFQISPALDITTPWSLSPAAAPASGYMKGVNTAGVVQQSFEAAINLAADVTGSLPNANLANPATTVNGQTCTLGSTCSITVGTGTVTAVSVATANGVSGTSSGGATPALTFTLGAITPTSTNGVPAATMAFLDATSSVQTQLNAKAPNASPTFTGTVTLPAGAVLNTPASVNLANGTNLPLTTGVTGVLPFANMSQPFVVNAQTATYQVLAADFTGCKTIPVASGTFTITLVASTSQPASGQCLDIINYGTGVVTVARSGQNLNGGTTSLTLAAGSATAPTGARIVSDGTNYEAALWGGSSGGSLPTGTTGQGVYYAAGGTTGTATSAITYTSASAGAPLGFNVAAPITQSDFAGSERHTLSGNASGITIGSGGWTTSVTSGPVSSTTGFPSTGGMFLIGGNGGGRQEVIFCTAASGTTLSGCTRGRWSMAAQTLNSGDPVTYIPWALSNGDTVLPSLVKLWNGVILQDPTSGIFNTALQATTSTGFVTPTIAANTVVFGVNTNPAISGNNNGITFYSNNNSLTKAEILDVNGFQSHPVATIAMTAILTTIAPVTPYVYTTGIAATAMATITVPSTASFSTSGFTGHEVFDGVNFTTVTGGNIANAVTAHGRMECDYNLSTTLWWCN